MSTHSVHMNYVSGLSTCIFAVVYYKYDLSESMKYVSLVEKNCILFQKKF